MTELHLPINEDLANYAFESAYLAEEGKRARYYLAGKGVCVTQDGELSWFEMPANEKDCFLFDDAVLNEYLHDDFTEDELGALTLIRTLDEQAREIMLHVVSTQNRGEGQYAVFYSEASEAYCMVSLDEIDRVNLITANLMAQLAPCSLAEPYILQIRADGAFEQ